MKFFKQVETQVEPEEEEWDFDREGSALIPKKGRLFSPLERGRLIFQIIEGAVDMPKGLV